MRTCQKEHFMKKLDGYQKSIDNCNITIEDQKKRIMCFQGLINQLREVLDNEAESSTRGPKPQGTKKTSPKDS